MQVAIHTSQHHFYIAPTRPMVVSPKQPVDDIGAPIVQQVNSQPRLAPVTFSAGNTPVPRAGSAYGFAQTLGQKQFSQQQFPGLPMSPEDSYKALIRSDIQTAFGRQATEEDFNYWLPKLEGANDSGFVTSGQMTATEYWHRRLLGWQAGGSDMATSGPYAGSPDAHGPVPSAEEVVPGIPPGMAAVGGGDGGGSAPMAPTAGASAPEIPASTLLAMASPQMIQAFRALIQSDIRTAYNREATEQDYNYWLPKLLGPNDSGFVTGGNMSATEYWHRRMLGWQAGGQDQAVAGPYAHSADAHGDVPSAQQVVPNIPSKGVVG